MQVDRKLIYLLFMLLITGAFASMAQNGYGNDMMGMVAWAFSIVFLVQFAGGINMFESVVIRLEYLIENMSLAVISFMFGLRLFYIYIDGIESVYIISVSVLLLIYIWKVIKRIRGIGESRDVRVKMGVFYLVITLFTVSMLLAPFDPGVSEVLGIVAFGLIVLLMSWVFVIKNFNFNTAVTELKKGISSRTNQALILITAYIIFSFYMGFSKIDLLPRMYSEDYPPMYYEMLDEELDRPLEEGTSEVEEFQKQYDRIGSKYLQD